MPRNKKCRMVSGLPSNTEFHAQCQRDDMNSVILTIEEYEVIKLIDYKGLTQEECALNMEVARTTVQQIYSDARKKIATSMVEGRNLVIKGGCYKLFDSCKRNRCRNGN